MANVNGDTLQILLDCVERVRNRSNTRPPYIFMVPSVLRDLSPTSYDPRMVSIGPLHKQDKNVQELEGVKESYLHDLLHSSSSKPEETLNSCVQKVNASIDRIKASYPDMKSYSDVDLAKMMVIDGCFILEFCFKHFKGYKRYLPNMMQNVCIAVDLILVENQIPFFVLQDLFDCTLREKISISLTKMLHKVLERYIHPFQNKLPENFLIADIVATDSTYDHVLSFLHNCYNLPSKPKDPESSYYSGTAVHSVLDLDTSCVSNKAHQPEKWQMVRRFKRSTYDHVLGFLRKFYKPSKPKDSESSENAETTVHSVVELDRSGVSFKPHQVENWPMAMAFDRSMYRFPWYNWGKPTLLMPTLVIDDISELVFRNFIALEQTLPQDHYHFTSYAYVMDKLIDNQDDVSKLVESKVVINRLGSPEEAANLINRICKNISIVDFCYLQELEQLDNYYNGSLPKNIAWLRRTYFNSPWNAIALFAGIILFFLTVAQTIFAILAM